jgi:hypothetical protein
MIYLNVTPLPHLGKYRLNSAVILDGILVEKGFEWDGASIPRILWVTVGSPFQPEFMAASMIHDKLYELGPASGFTKKQADELFKKILIAEGVSETKAHIMYMAVRAAGRGNYRN